MKNEFEKTVEKIKKMFSGKIRIYEHYEGKVEVIDYFLINDIHVRVELENHSVKLQDKGRNSFLILENGKMRIINSWKNLIFHNVNFFHFSRDIMKIRKLDKYLINSGYSVNYDTKNNEIIYFKKGESNENS